MTRDDIAAKVRAILAENLNQIEIDESNTIVEDIEADSLDVVNILVDIEEEFEIKMPDGVAKTIVTVGDLVKHVEVILNEKVEP